MSAIKEIEGIREKLIELNFNVSSKGFEYWLILINEYIKRNKYTTIESIYNLIAKIYNTTRDRVERNIRTASKQALQTIREHYKYKNRRLSTKDILELIYWEMVQMSLNDIIFEQMKNKFEESDLFTLKLNYNDIRFLFCYIETLKEEIGKKKIDKTKNDVTYKYENMIQSFVLKRLFLYL